MFLFLSAALFAEEKPKTDAETEVIAVLDEIAEVGAKKDLEAMNKLYAEDYFHINADGTIMTRSQMFSFYRTPSSGQIESSSHDEERVQLHDNVGIVNARITITGHRDGKPYSATFRVTYVLIKREGQWKVAASHASIVMS